MKYLRIARKDKQHMIVPDAMSNVEEAKDYELSR